MHEAVAPLQMGLNVVGGFGVLGVVYAAGGLVGRIGRHDAPGRRRTRTREVSLTGIPNIGKATTIGALLGAVSVGVPVAIALVLLGGGPMTVIFAAHVGFFGGMGYGAMLGAVIQADRSERRRG